MKRNTPSDTQRSSRIDGIWPRPRPVVMGVLNCTPDSFSDGGEYYNSDLAVARGLSLLDEGADIVDVGGESTRPGAAAVDASQECDRILPVISGIRETRADALISVDTCKPRVAEAALAAGADLVNDVRAASDPDMLGVVAANASAIILMHMRGTPRSMQKSTAYSHVVAEVFHFLRSRAEQALAAGVPPQRIWLDPGIGFAKDDPGNLELLTALPDLAALGFPVVVGPSRKSFIGRLTGAPVDQRLPGTMAALIPTLVIARVVARVHDPAPIRQFLAIASRLRGAAA